MNPGTRLGPYELVSRLGAGGMGEVWRARDTRLDRSVAIKILPAEFASDTQLKIRFEREAKTISQLNHPHICTLFDLGENYMVMELIEGETLAALLSRGPLPVREVLRFGAEIAEALDAAHRAGIVHRDLKPGNIMITTHGAKLLDFGLAKTGIHSIETPDDATVQKPLTRGGTIVGTFQYMAPEQVTGEAADARSDIFALGAVLYEMLTGARAFDGKNRTSLVAAILTAEPRPIRSLRPGTSPAIEDLVGKCLAKSPDARWQSAREIAAALRRIGEAAAHPVATTPSREAATQRSIAVLPFANLSSDPENEYFSDGLTDEIITDLSKVRSLRVISRTSAMALKATQKDVRAIGRELDVRYVLQGSVRRAANALRVTAQLIDAETDAHEWAEKYEGSIDDVFAIQERLSRAIVEALRIRLDAGEERQIAARPIADVRAYDCYLRARHEIWSFSKEGLERAEQLVRAGLDITGENALLAGTMGLIHCLSFSFGVDRRPEREREAEEWAQRAASLDPDSPYAHYVFGALHHVRAEPQKAVRSFRRALMLDPNDTNALIYLANVLIEVGREDDAEPLLQRLIEVDPLTPMNHAMQGYPHLVRGDAERALAHYRRAHAMAPDVPMLRYFYSSVLTRAGWRDEAERIVTPLARRGGITIWECLAQLLFHTLRGDAAAARSVLTPDFIALAQRVGNFARDVAEYAAMLGWHDEALDWLATTIRRGYFHHPFLARHDPLLEPVRNHPRFGELMEEARRNWESFEASVMVNSPPVRREFEV